MASDYRKLASNYRFKQWPANLTTYLTENIDHIS